MSRELLGVPLSPQLLYIAIIHNKHVGALAEVGLVRRLGLPHQVSALLHKWEALELMV